MIGHPATKTIALLEESGHRCRTTGRRGEADERRGRGHRGRGNVEYTNRSLLAELERLIGLDQTAKTTTLGVSPLSGVARYSTPHALSGGAASAAMLGDFGATS